MSEKVSSFFFLATFQKEKVFQDDQILLEVKSDKHQLSLVTLIGDETAINRYVEPNQVR